MQGSKVDMHRGDTYLVLLDCLRQLHLLNSPGK
jgi:hypothetical protein